jgi:hypothetical protein
MGNYSPLKIKKHLCNYAAPLERVKLEPSFIATKTPLRWSGYYVNSPLSTREWT